MAIVEYILEKANESDEVLVFTKTGFSFSASFIRKNNLEQMRSVKVLKDDENPYWLGFKFLDASNVSNSLALLNKQGDSGKTTAARAIKAAQIYSKSETLRSIRDDESKISRRFAIQWDVTKRLYFVELRPTFEKRTPFDDRLTIDPSARGIYRYKNSSDKVIYIGKGVIRDRAQSPERQKWQIKTIEYSICKSDNDAFRWEAYYINDYESKEGKIPPFNEIKGRCEN